MDIDRIPSGVLAAIRKYLGASHGGDTSYDDEISDMTANEAFSCYCNWHGLIDWSGDLRFALDSLRVAER